MNNELEQTNSTKVEEFLSNLTDEKLSNETVNNLIVGLSQKYPENEITKKLLETIEVEIERERTESEYPWILFALNGTAYSINSKYVLSIEILNTVTPIVDSAHYSPGFTESRGEMIELIDMLALFGSGSYLDGKNSNSDAVNMMIVTIINGVKRGIIVDEILAV